MARFTHTVKLAKEKDSLSMVRPTRKSNRRYAACLITTSTLRSVQIANANLQEKQRALRETEDKIDKLSYQTGLTYAAAKELLRKQEREYFDAYHLEYAKIRNELATSNDVRDRVRTAIYRQKDIHSETRKVLLARGISDPGFDNPVYTLVKAHETLQFLKKFIAEWKPLEVGSQAVISWHSTLEHAKRALSGATAGCWRQRGDMVEVCTAIKVTPVCKL
jgi:hypothetical protein